MKEFQARSRASVLLIVAILVIYIVLGILYESLIHPITILSGLPSAGIRRAAHVDDLPQGTRPFAFVGLIMLFGMVKKNAIMMIDFAFDASALTVKTPPKPSTRAASCASVRS